MKSLWSDREAKKRSGVNLVVYTSRLIGVDPNLVLWGGGNSSIKVEGLDHKGQPTRILWVKGSGSDMRTITPENFTPLRLDDLLPLKKREAMTDEEMVDYQLKSVLNPKAPKPSIETLLHAFLPAKHIYHTHADAICALTDTTDSKKIVEKVYGKEVALVHYTRPGFLLSKRVAEAYRKHPGLRAIILDKHGLITWGKSAKDAYDQTIRMVSEAERYTAQKKRGKQAMGLIQVKPLARKERQALAAALLPVLRGEVSQNKRMILQFDDSKQVLNFIGSAKARRLTQIGPFTPDHLLHTKPWPLFVKTKNPGDIKRLISEIGKACEGYRERSVKYFNRYKTEGVTMLDPNPRIILIPGIGMFTTGKDQRAAGITRDLYLHTMSVIEAAEAIDGYRSISTREICNFEYWPMENYKLTLLPAEKEFSRKIVLVTGGAGAIGRAIAESFVEAGASVILADIQKDKAEDAAAKINAKAAGGGEAIALEMDVTSEKSVRCGFETAALYFGGLDIFVSNAGIARCAAVDQLSRSDWDASLAVNATGHFLTSKAALQIMRAQRLGGAVVVVATKNVLAPGKDFGAYSASKAAQAQLARIMAIENAEAGIRVNMVNPDGVFEASGLWSKKIREDRAQAHKVALEDLEGFYAKRNLLKTRISARDVAQSVLFFSSERAAKTTGAILPVDGGVKEAFPR
ncbi:MAG: bifunctional rhamnulose-1-phosphate aldolase/short-chain dehydrogenase [Nitrospiria bacterium]